MARREIFGIWPDNYKDTMAVVGGLVGQMSEDVSSRPLSEDELESLNSGIKHAMGAWDVKYSNPLIRRGLSVVQIHFARTFNIDSGITGFPQYRKILSHALSTGYFENTERQGGVEIDAFSNLMTGREVLHKRSPEQEKVDSEIVKNMVLANLNLHQDKYS